MIMCGVFSTCTSGSLAEEPKHYRLAAAAQTLGMLFCTRRSGLSSGQNKQTGGSQRHKGHTDMTSQVSPTHELAALC